MRVYAPVSFLSGDEIRRLATVTRFPCRKRRAILRRPFSRYVIEGFRPKTVGLVTSGFPTERSHERHGNVVNVA